MILVFENVMMYKRRAKRNYVYGEKGGGWFFRSVCILFSLGGQVELQQ